LVLVFKSFFAVVGIADTLLKASAGLARAKFIHAARKGVALALGLL
jgi:hypothetical protein